MTRILIAEDDSVFCTLLLELLEAAGYEVTVAVDGQAALAYAKIGSFDALIADIIMPHMDGLELIRMLRRERPDLPVIAISATEGGEPGQDYLSAAAIFGANATIGKRRIAAIVPILRDLLSGQAGKTAKS